MWKGYWRSITLLKGSKLNDSTGSWIAPSTFPDSVPTTPACENICGTAKAAIAAKVTFLNGRRYHATDAPITALRSMCTIH